MKKRDVTRRAVLKLAGGAAVAALSAKEAAGAIGDVTALAPVRAMPVTGPDKPNFAHLLHSITRIYEATRIPPIPPSEYKKLFQLVASECQQWRYTPVQMRTAVHARAKRERIFESQDVDFVLDTLQGSGAGLDRKSSSASLAQSYRGFISAKCRETGIELSETDRAVIDAWFGSSG